MFEKISRKIGFTEIEIKVILFLVIGFLIGFGIKIIKNGSISKYNSYDYAREDSLFEFYKSNSKKNREDEEKNKDSDLVQLKREVLNLEEINYTKGEEKKLPAENSININSAGKDELMSLPGIGEKTAQKIIDLRTERGKFEKMEELKDVKGIGEAKFNKIKKFLYIK